MYTLVLYTFSSVLLFLHTFLYLSKGSGVTMKINMLLVGFAIFAFGCSSSPNMKNWRGEPMSKLIESYGTPDSFLKLGDGSKVIEYEKDSLVHVSKDFCTLTLFIDHRNLVKGVKLHGNGIGCKN